MLSLISTPIGNLDDISLRAIDVIKSADFIYTEDTRSFKKILDSIYCKKKYKSFHEHNEDIICKEIIKHLKNKKRVVLTCEAGTPAISDPGYKLIRECLNLNLKYTLIPGPSSLINAVVLSGLPTDKFSFYGFIPKKNNAQKKLFQKVSNDEKTVIMFESVKRLRKTIISISKYLDNNRHISVCREMTKIHEQIVQGNCEQLLKKIDDGSLPLKGEIVLVIEGSITNNINIRLDNKVKDTFLEKLSISDAAKLLSLVTGQSRQDIYKFLNNK